MAKTQLKKITIEKFRALNNVEVEFGDYITVICGKNGTSKSSILGIAAQIFSFDTDYIKDEGLSFTEIGGGYFKSQYRDHFRISKQFDLPGSMRVNVELYDGYTNKNANGILQLDKRGTSPRPVVRKNSTAPSSDLASRNFTQPVIFLSLKRLYPIANREYKKINFDYLEEHKQDFISLTNELLNRSSTRATGTHGTITSAVAHGDNYDHESVSAGEDNVGQIILALMSFRKLKADYADYKGGLLLIDEADAGLFPTAQINLLKLLERECRDLELQVVMTSHSPTLIGHAYEQSRQFRKRYKTIYLSDTFGSVQVMQDWSWPQISADINTTTLEMADGVALPKVNVYFEDGEAEDFFAALLNRQRIKKFIVPMSGITLGCSNYLQLIQKKVPEFSQKSIVCLDADQQANVDGKNLKTVSLLPGHLPPDQLIFEHLFNLSADDDFWKNDLQFTRKVFTNAANEVIAEFGITGLKIKVSDILTGYKGEKTPRDIFKRFYKCNVFQKLMVSVEKSSNPWRHWIEKNPELANKFLEQFKATIYDVMKNGYAVDEAKLTALEVKLKKVPNVL
jgi:predicted ATPase